MSDAAKVAIQGEAGSFSHQAALELLGEQVEIVPRASFDALFEAVVSSSADRAVLHARIGERFAAMLAAGLVDEVTALRGTTVLATSPASSFTITP